MRVGIEIGGTFSDLVAISETGEIETAKALSTPRAPAEGALAALKNWRPDASQVSALVHGSTVATNAVIERKGAATALITNRGHRDVLEIQRHEKSEIFNIRYDSPRHLVPRNHVIEVDGRLDYAGNEIAPLLLDAAFEDSLRRLIEIDGIRTVAVSLLHSYLNPAHEKAVARRIAQLWPDVDVSCSHVINPEYREYERASTTVISAYLKPVISSYMRNIDALMRANGLQSDIQIMQSSGGIIPLAAAQEKAVNVVLSGPAAGVVGALHIGGLTGERNFITLDMGGTSTDVCLISDLQAAISYDNKVDGLSVRAPTFDIQVVGAGGGSIAGLDAANFLRVGPQSAGSDPGPCCYGRGGTQPTVSDASALLGLLRPHRFFGGKLELRLDLARAAVEKIALPLGLSVEEACEGIRRIANTNMTETIRLVSIERGHNPQDYAILAYGGGGALHACEVADDLNIAKVIVPEHQGVLSAFGLLVSAFSLDLLRADLKPLASRSMEGLADAYDALKAEARAEFQRYGIDSADIEYDLSVDLRYAGQASDLNIPLELQADNIPALRTRFDRTYHERFGHSFPEKPVDSVNLRLVARRRAADVRLREKPEGAAPSFELAPIFTQGAWREARFYWRPDLPAKARAHGPAVVEDHFATTFIPTGWSMEVHPSGSLILERAAS